MKALFTGESESADSFCIVIAISSLSSLSPLFSAKITQICMRMAVSSWLRRDRRQGSGKRQPHTPAVVADDWLRGTCRTATIEAGLVLLLLASRARLIWCSSSGGCHRWRRPPRRAGRARTCRPVVSRRTPASSSTTPASFARCGVPFAGECRREGEYGQVAGLSTRLAPQPRLRRVEGSRGAFPCA